MADFNDKNYIIEAKGEAPYASPIEGGYELVSNKRDMRFLIKKQEVRNVDAGMVNTNFAVFCMVKEEGSWIHTNNTSSVNTITEFVRKINASPYFTKAVNEYRQQVGIKDEWNDRERFKF